MRFEFFHRLTDVRLSQTHRLQDDEPPFVEALEFDVQARIKGGREYEPLIDVRGLPCWPSAPRYEQLENGEQLVGHDLESQKDPVVAERKTLQVAADFDLVVIGVGLGAIPYVCREVVARDPRWRAMVDHVKTVATQAFQLWMHADMKELGYPDAPITASGFVEPFDTWADMRHLIPQESWSEAPRSLAYFCSVLPDPDGPQDPLDRGVSARQQERARRNAIRFLNQDIVRLWPAATDARGKFRWDLLADPADGTGTKSSAVDEERFASQFWKANVDPSDRYVLSLPGSSSYRISPLDGAYDNLTIAGDWTDCGFNGGCVEAAFMSGRLAAHAISQSPPLEDIVGFDHP